MNTTKVGLPELGCRTGRPCQKEQLRPQRGKERHLQCLMDGHAIKHCGDLTALIDQCLTRTRAVLKGLGTHPEKAGLSHTNRARARSPSDALHHGG